MASPIPQQVTRRRNRHASAARYPLTSLPPLPMPRAGVIAWHPSARRHWRVLTAAPWTALWQESDRLLAERWLRLLNRLLHALDDPDQSPAGLKALAAEIRALEDALGASPKARASLRWQAVGGGPTGSTGDGGTVLLFRASDLDDHDEERSDEDD